MEAKQEKDVIKAVLVKKRKIKLSNDEKGTESKQKFTEGNDALVNETESSVAVIPA